MTYAERIAEKANEAELLTAYANATTGASDTLLGDAVRTLVAGYGQGGLTINTFTAPKEISLSSEFYNLWNPPQDKICVLWNPKDETDSFVTQELLFMVSALSGQSTNSRRFFSRYNGSSGAYVQSVSSSYNAKASAGQEFLWIAI